MQETLFTYSEDEVRQLALRLYPRITAYIRGMLGARHAALAEDIFHDAICKFLDKRTPIAASKVPAYLYRTVRNMCINQATRPRFETSAVSMDSEVQSAWDTLAALDFASQAPDVEIESDPTPDINDIIAYSDSLPSRTRSIFYMSRIEGMTHKEIAEHLDISTRAVEKHLQTSIIEYRQRFGYGSRGDKKIS